jgi:hypothetical protein
MPSWRICRNQATQPVGDGADRLGVSESENEPAMHDGEDCAFGPDCHVRGLIEEARVWRLPFGERWL